MALVLDPQLRHSPEDRPITWQSAMNPRPTDGDRQAENKTSVTGSTLRLCWNSVAHMSPLLREAVVQSESCQQLGYCCPKNRLRERGRGETALPPHPASHPVHQHVSPNGVSTTRQPVTSGGGVQAKPDLHTRSRPSD